MIDAIISHQTLSLKLALLILRLIGGFQIKRTILGYGTIASMFFANVFMVMDIALNFTGVESLRRIAHLPGLFISSFKGGILIIYSKHLVEIVNNLQYFWTANKFGKQTEKEIKFFFRKIAFITLYYMSSAYVVCAMMALLPFFHFEHKTLIYNNFALCNIQNLSCWIPMYIWQLFALACQMLPSAVCFDSLFVTLVGYIMTSCKLLKIGLQQLNTENVQKRNYYLKEIIKQHDFMMDFLSSMNNMFNVVMLLQFSCSFWSMLLFLHMIVVNGYKMADVIYFGIFYLIILVEIFTYATGGTIVEERVRNVATDMYNVNWYGKNKTNLRKALTLMIFRAQRTKILDVGKMSDLNYPLFLAVVKNAISVVTLISQLADQDSK